MDDCLSIRATLQNALSITVGSVWLFGMSAPLEAVPTAEAWRFAQGASGDEGTYRV
jgi:hypothetical protein